MSGEFARMSGRRWFGAPTQGDRVEGDDEIVVNLQSIIFLHLRTALSASSNITLVWIRDIARPWLACMLTVMVLVPHAHAIDEVVDEPGDDSEVICAVPPDYPSLSERLSDAVRFAIDPTESAAYIQELVERRVEHLFAVVTTFSLNGRVSQHDDLAMLKWTAPTEFNQTQIDTLMAEVVDRSRTDEGEAIDLNLMWDRIYETHRFEEPLNWVCLRAEHHGKEMIQAVLGYGVKSCGVMERLDGLEEAKALAVSHGWTLMTLERLAGREVDIVDTDLTAPLYAIRELEFYD